MVILLSGSINAGKSTVAEELSSLLPNAALIEVDALRDMVAWMPLEDSIPLNLENAISLIENFDRHGLHAIVPYPLSKTNYEVVTSALGVKGIKHTAFTLAPNLEVALTDRGTRRLTDEERERIQYHYDIGIATPEFGVVIDNSTQTPQETAAHIMHLLEL